MTHDNDPNLVSKIKRVVSPLVLAKNHLLATTMVPPKVKQNCIKLYTDKNMILYYEFSPWRFIKCLLKLLSVDEAYSHWLHLFDFSPLCVFKCVLKLPAREDA